MYHSDGMNYSLGKGMYKQYLRKVNPCLKDEPGYKETPTQTEATIHACRGFPGTPYSPEWQAQYNYIPRKRENVLYRYILIGIRREHE